jgi:hypothetical protein
LVTKCGIEGVLSVAYFVLRIYLSSNTLRNTHYEKWITSSQPLATYSLIPQLMTHNS